MVVSLWLEPLVRAAWAFGAFKGNVEISQPTNDNERVEGWGVNKLIL